jgi:hypothetical protein
MSSFKKGDEVIYQSTTGMVLEYGKKYIVEYTNSMTGWIGLENHSMNFDPKYFELVVPIMGIHAQSLFTKDDLETGMQFVFRDQSYGLVLKDIGIIVNSSVTPASSTTYNWIHYTQSLEYDNPFKIAIPTDNHNKDIMRVMVGMRRGLSIAKVSPFENLWIRP